MTVRKLVGLTALLALAACVEPMTKEETAEIGRLSPLCDQGSYSACMRIQTVNRDVELREQRRQAAVMMMAPGLMTMSNAWSAPLPQTVQPMTCHTFSYRTTCY